MTALLAREMTAWVVVALVIITVALPYLVRGRWLATTGPSVGYLPRMAPHYWIGYTIAGLSLAHAGLAMSGPLGSGTGVTTGLWVAAAVTLLIVGQVSLGQNMRRLRGPGRRRQRRLHFLIMVGIGVGGSAHVLLNGPIVGLLAGPG